jgi:hypothetical protein
MKQRYLLPFWCMRNSFKEVALATKAKTPARTQGFFQFQMVARGGIDQGPRMSYPNEDDK